MTSRLALHYLCRRKYGEHPLTLFVTAASVAERALGMGWNGLEVVDSKEMTFQCSICSNVHEGLPHLGCEFPDPYFDVPTEERETRVRVTSDLCSIDDTDFFIRGVIEINVHGIPNPFGFGVWVSQKKENFETYIDNFHTDSIGPFFGWLSNSLTCYDEDTYALKTTAHFRSGGTRPFIEVEPTDHPLAIDQRDGITIERALQLVHHYM